MWFVKSKRAQSADDYETWIAGGVATTLNVMDNTGDSRATVLIFYGNRVNDIRIQRDVINTLQARMGTGGGNMPIIFSHTQGIDPQPSLDNSPTLRSGGNGMAVAVDLYNATVNEDNFHTLRVGGLGADGTPNIMSELTVRRLTPVECERLQGFPNNWTEGQADTHRYKQMGNAVAVPVVSWLVNRLMEVANDLD